MRALIIYDSVYGNTESVAKAIGAAIGPDAKFLKADLADAGSFRETDLLIIGSPTLGGRPTESIQKLLASLPGDALKGLKAATFDTRYSGKFVKMFGFAAEKMADAIAAKGGTLALPPEPFIVTGKKGPLKDGELLRAAEWARKLVQ